MTWYNDNCLMVNPDEIQLLMINSQNDKDQALLTSNAHVIKSTEDFSLLGVNIEEHLRLYAFVNCVKKKRNLIPISPQYCHSSPYMALT